MAIIPYKFTVKVRDGKNQYRTMKFTAGVNDATHATAEDQYAALRTYVGAFVTELDEAIDAVIVGVDMGISFLSAATGLKTTAGENSVGEGADLKFYINALKTFNWFLAAAKDALFVSGSPVVDTGAGALLAVLDQLDLDDGVVMLWSDGEVINTGLGVQGLVDGYWASRARSPRP